MGKKNRKGGYDKERLRGLAVKLVSLEDDVFPDNMIELSELEKAILKLPSKERKSLETFWGLIPGSIDHSRHSDSKKNKELAYCKMQEASSDAIRILLSIEYVSMYDKHAQELISMYLSKVNRSGAETISDIDTMKYILIFWYFFLHGPKMFFEEAETPMTLRHNMIRHLGEYSLLTATWEDMVKYLPNESINIKLLIEAINMFDVKDVYSMKKFVGLSISKNDSDMVTESFKHVAQIRFFKEALFPHGDWDITEQLILGYKTDQIDMEELSEVFGNLHSDWTKVEEYKNGKKTIVTSKGKLEFPVYEIAGLKFTDAYEIMFLCVSTSLV